MLKKDQETILPQCVVYNELDERIRDSLQLLRNETMELSRSFEQSIGQYYQTNFERIVKVVLIYDNLRKVGMPLHGIQKKDLFLHKKNKLAIIR